MQINGHEVRILPEVDDTGTVILGYRVKVGDRVFPVATQCYYPAFFRPGVPTDPTNNIAQAMYDAERIQPAPVIDRAEAKRTRGSD